LKNLLSQRQAYIDTNIFFYVATKHPKFYTACVKVLEALTEEEYVGYGSNLVLFELFGSLSKLNAKAAYNAAIAYLSLPLHILRVDREVLAIARDIAELSNTTYDAIHAALIAKNCIDTVITEDIRHWRKIASIWDYIEKKYDTCKLTLFSPTKGFIKMQQ